MFEHLDKFDHDVFCIVTLWETYTKLLKMAIEIVDFLIKKW